MKRRTSAGRIDWQRLRASGGWSHRPPDGSSSGCPTADILMNDDDEDDDNDDNDGLFQTRQ